MEEGTREASVEEDEEGILSPTGSRAVQERDACRCWQKVQKLG